MAYLVLARKYRPQTFEDVVGQSHVTQTLGNAIQAGRVSHANLFAGPRGTGKTTLARILAKAVNCQTGSTATPCNHCQSCREITASSGVDVFEIDGASNNGVDQIRELRDNVRYMPVHSRYKIYIIDEVHMLSTAAFNALLKTLEEPPAHILFMFATTEPHKIPITILSRCQRHDLRRIALSEISGFLATLCAQESVTVDTAGLELIARESGGSMRDALSLLDQIIAGLDGQVDYERMVDLLGMVDTRFMSDFIQALMTNDITRLLAGIDHLYSHGYDIPKFYADLIAALRDRLVARIQGRGQKAVADTAEDLEGAESAAHLSQVLAYLYQQQVTLKFAEHIKLTAEIIFLNLVQIQPALPIDTLIEKLELVQAASVRADDGRPSAQPQPVKAQPAAVPLPVDKAPPAAPAPALSAGDSEKPPPDNSPDAAWASVKRQIAQEAPSLAAALSNSRILGTTKDTVTLEVHAKPFALSMVKRDKHLRLLETLIGKLYKRSLQVIVEAVAEEDAGAASGQQHAQNELKQKALQHPLVTKTVHLFDGKIVGQDVDEKK